MSRNYTEDGGPAFPVGPPKEFSKVTYANGEITATVAVHPGMTLRDWLVGQALAGCASECIMYHDTTNRYIQDHGKRKAITNAAYRIADELLAGRAD